MAAAGIALAAPAYADVDTDFANELHIYGIYGPRDYNAWLGKITCDRMGRGLDGDAFASTRFLAKNLPKGSTTQQTWQFLSTSINYYCPDLRRVLDQAAAGQGALNAAEQPS
jgi:hypothetical protein